MQDSHTLIVRKHTRHDVALPAALTIAAPHAEQIRFTGRASLRDGALDAYLVDASPGGLGFITTTFLPKGARLIARVLSPTDPSAAPLLETSLLLQRVSMTDRRPGYLLGTVFADRSPEAQAAFDRFMSALTDGAPADA
ncbi:MAG: hypothetical protein AB7G17_01705 [Phycisphaerales bacterium]